MTCLILAAGAAPPASAQTAVPVFMKLHDFGATTTDGFDPHGSLVKAADGSILGTTEYGGAGTGTVFQYTTAGTYQTLDSFAAATGVDPTGGLILGTDSNYYGTAGGGSASDGVAFKLTSAGTFTDVGSFSTTVPNPIGLVQGTGTDTSFYGVTRTGGDNGTGTIFKLDSAGTVTVLYSFTAVDDTGRNLDGAAPVATPIFGPDGNLYGTATLGGNSGGAGATIGSDGGTIWECSTSGAFNVVHLFSAVDGMVFNTDGSYPVGGLTVANDGTTLLGATARGGSAGTGVVFDVNLSGTTFTALHMFDKAGSGSPAINVGGDSPYGGVVQLGDGVVYGTTVTGGTNGYGTVFSISKIDGTGTFTDVHDFAATDGIIPVPIVPGVPNGILVLGGDGNLYGTSPTGGANTVTYPNETGSTMTGGTLYTLLTSATDGAGATVTSLNPASVQAGSPSFTVTVTGTGFDATAQAEWLTTSPSGAIITTALATTYVSPTQVDAIVPASLLVTDATLNSGVSETRNIVVTDVDTKTTAPSSVATLFALNPPANIPPVLTTISPASIIAGSPAVTLTITGSNLVSGDTLTVGGTVLTPVQFTTSQATVVVPASLLTTAGTVSVIVTSSAGSSNALALVVSPVTTYQGGLQLISLPYDYSSLSLATVFGYSNPKLAVWNPATNAYAVTPTAPADAIRLGHGYWVRFPTLTSVVIAGATVPAGTPFTIGLTKGWNMIGDPFTTTAPGTGMIVTDSKGVVYTFADAASAGVINSSTYSYDLGSHQYILETTGDVQPFAGYWLFADENCTLSMNGS